MSAPRVHPTYVLPPQEFASKYVKRCSQCRVVRGNSQFNGKPGYRSDVCRFCSQVDTARGRQLRARIRSLAKLRAREERLADDLASIRAQIRDAEAAILSQQQTNLFPPN